MFVDGLSVGEVTETSLKDRRILGDEGFISAVVVIDSTSGKLVAGPEIHARGSGIDEAAFADGPPAAGGGAGAGRGQRRHRRASAWPAGPADAGKMGQRQTTAAGR